MGHKSSKPSGAKQGEKLERQSELGLQLPLRALKGVLANDKGKGMSFAKIRKACAASSAKTSRQQIKNVHAEVYPRTQNST